MCHWAVIFDVDGTMVDNRRFHEAAWIELGRLRGLNITAEFYRTHIHSRSNAEIESLLLDGHPDRNMIANLAEEKEAIYRRLYRPALREVPGLRELLAALSRAGVPCAAASNSPKANVDMVLDELGIRSRFACVTDCTQVRKGKPDPELLLTSAERLGTPIKRCLVLEDSISGFAAAEAAGSPYIVVTAGAEAAELCHATSALAVVRDFTELSVPQMARWALGEDR